MLRSTVTLLVVISLWNIHVLAVSTYDEFARVGSPHRESHDPNHTSIAARLSRNILYHPKRVVWLSESSRRKQRRQAIYAGKDASSLAAERQHLQEIFQASLGQLTDDFQRLKKYINANLTTSAHDRWITKQPSRGILISAGGATLIAHVWVTLRVLRDVLKCCLPVEIVYFGPHELPSETQAEIQASFRDITFIDGNQVRLPMHQTDLQEDKTRKESTLGFSLKVLAIYAVTSFDQVLLLDADALPLRDPTYLFETEEFQKHGSLFFPDWWTHDGVSLLGVKSQAYEVFKLNPPWDSPKPFLATESGAVLMDRRRHASVLECLMFLNSHPTIFYNLMHGDKDTYRLAFSMLHSQDFYQVDTPARAALDSSSLKEPDGYLRHVGMVQHDPKGRIWLLHRTAEGKVQLGRKNFPVPDTLTVPLNPQRARRLIRPGRGLGYSHNEVDWSLWETCGRGFSDKYLWIAACDVGILQGITPTPVMPLSVHTEISPALAVAHNCFLNITASVSRKGRWKGFKVLS
eukprot:jgi/Botrbrau1/17476/Bobra.0054s0063.1